MPSDSRTPTGSIRMYVIYDHPRDYPNCFVVRLWEGGRPTLTHVLASSLDHARKQVPHGLTRIPRVPQDDPVIVETWI